MKPKSAAKSSTPMVLGLSRTNGVRAVATSKPARVSDQASFLWETCSELMERNRVDIKQQAVLDGFRLGERLSNILRSQIKRQNQGPGTEEFADWVDQFDAAKDQYETPHSTVGLIGALGSGKSTLLNAILEQRDLLPPSNDGAGTAAACKVVYKYGSDGYHARIVFRSRQSFTDELDRLFKNLEAKRELQASKGLADTEIDDTEDQLEEIETNTSDILDVLHVLWGVREEDLCVTSTEEFLDAHPLRVLGTTIEITEADRETFLAKTKPFMDSTPSDCDGEELIVTPLVEHMTIFVKSDILKYGLELVDLPGLGDVVESRSRVAERFSQSLDITAIVAPAIRATEEKAVLRFIKRRQESEMRMNGKFDRDSLCVIISKSEDMDWNGYLGSRWIAKKYPDIPGHLLQVKALEKYVRTAEQELGGFQPQVPAYDTTTAAVGSIQTARQDLFTLRDSLKQAAVFIRNQSVSERIQKEFRGRQVTTKSVEDDQFHTSNVEVFPTSARAFHELRHAGSVKEVGFPTERHTGIPQFKQWLVEATFKKREKHLDAILNQLSALFIRIQTWISISNGETTASTTGLLDSLDYIHQKYQRSIDEALRQSGAKLRQIEPLKAGQAAIANCQRDYPGKVDRWRYRYPEKTDSDLKVFGVVQKCILRKHGEHHQSKGKYSNEYQWVDDLASVFTETIINDWHHTFSETVPAYEVKIQGSLEHVWKHYLTSLESFCAMHNASYLRDNGKVRKIIENAKAQVDININMILTRFKTGAQSVHPIFRQEIQKTMIPVFDEAYSLKGGGCVQERNSLLQTFIAEHSADMPVRAYEKMEAALADLIQLHVGAIEGLAGGVISTVERSMKLLLGGSLVSSSPAEMATMKELAEEINPHLASWKMCWQRLSNRKDDHVMRGDFSIPEPDFINIDGDSGKS